MALSELIGREVTFGPLEVTEETIKAFAAGVNESDWPTNGPAHPFHVAASLIPGTGQVLFQRGARVDLSRIVHGGIEIQFDAPIQLGDQLTCTAALRGVDEKSSGRLLDIGFSVRSGDALVASGKTLYFERGSGKSGGGSDDASLDSQLEFTVETSDDQSLRYAEGSGDRFPIHTDDEFARGAGLPGVIMHGMCTLALSTGAIVRSELDGRWSELEQVRCRFTGMVLPGSPLRVVGREGGGEIAFETYAEDSRAISDGVLKVRER